MYTVLTLIFQMKLVPQSLYMNIHGAGAAVKIISPYHVQQLFSGKSNIPVSDQYLEKFIFFGRAFDSRPVQKNLMSVKIAFQAAPS